jgi:diguanylate cyclase (GGDEF)-like protein/PAS domain S-box-containing protein
MISDDREKSPSDLVRPETINKAALSTELLDRLFDGVYFVDRERRISYWNDGAERLTGYSRTEALDRHCFENFLAHVDDTGKPLCTDGCPLTATFLDGEPREQEVYLRQKNGQRIPVCVRVAPVRDARGNILGAVEVFSDISAKITLERRLSELERLAYTDHLTGAYNRRYFSLKLDQALDEIEQFDKTFALLLIDLDHFKEINDKHGHSAGDAVLKAVAGTLLRNLRVTDSLGRWGGEEFILLIPGLTWLELPMVADKCRALIEQSCALVDGIRIHATASIGATLLEASDTAEGAVKRADELMYRSKTLGRNLVSMNRERGQSDGSSLETSLGDTGANNAVTLGEQRRGIANNILGLFRLADQKAQIFNGFVNNARS